MMLSDVICTSSGKVKGKVFKLKDGKPVSEYRNIPYGKPPTGPLRFMPPVPAERWDGIRDGTVVGNKPWYGTSFDGAIASILPLVEPDSKSTCDEDCLHVTLYTPYPEKGKNLPVMVWFYGGGFRVGWEGSYDGKVLSGMNDVVVVVPNYRVGVFGFFSLGPDSPCPGNAGLLDQQLALRWVQENIDNFGGDKNNVTIFGQSAGGASVHIQLLSPLARGLFHKAISHSGQAFLTTMTYNDKMRIRSNKLLAEQLKLVVQGAELLKALQEIPAEELMDALVAITSQKAFFMPVTDGIVLPQNVEEMVDCNNFAKVPYIIGCNNTEGCGFLVLSTFQAYMKGLTEEESRKRHRILMNDEAYEKFKKQYLREEHGDMKFSMLLSDSIGEGLFIAPAVHSAIKHAEAGADVYLYFGEFQLKMHHDDNFNGKLVKKASWCHCDHSDELLMTFGTPFSPKGIPKGAKFSEDEAEISRGLMTYLTNFAKTGDPNNGRNVKTKWPIYQPFGEHLVVAAPFSTGKKLGEGAVNFWMEEMRPHIA